jgi:hypothetical protein
VPDARLEKRTRSAFFNALLEHESDHGNADIYWRIGVRHPKWKISGRVEALYARFFKVAD